MAVQDEPDGELEELLAELGNRLRNLPPKQADVVLWVLDGVLATLELNDFKGLKKMASEGARRRELADAAESADLLDVRFRNSLRGPRPLGRAADEFLSRAHERLYTRAEQADYLRRIAVQTLRIAASVARRPLRKSQKEAHIEVETAWARDGASIVVPALIGAFGRCRGLRVAVAQPSELTIRKARDAVERALLVESPEQWEKLSDAVVRACAGALGIARADNLCR